MLHLASISFDLVPCIRTISKKFGLGVKVGVRKIKEEIRSKIEVRKGESGGRGGDGRFRRRRGLHSAGSRPTQHVTESTYRILTLTPQFSLPFPASFLVFSRLIVSMRVDLLSSIVFVYLP